MFLPPGFRFHPTDVELVKYYLKGKVMGKKFPFEAISELNIYKFSPWELPVKSFLQSKDHEWYFFCPRERKYASGTRTSRTTENGYWKITCKDKPVRHNEQAVGMVKTLVFHKGHAPRAERTDWFMHEYWIDDKDLNDAGVIQDAYVLCRIFKKSGPGSKNDVQYGEQFSEEDRYDEVEDAPSSAAFVLPNNQNISAVTSMLIPENTSSISMSEAGPSNAVLFAEEVPQSPADDFDIDSLWALLQEDSTLLSVENNNNLMPDDFNHDKNIGAVSCLDGNYINNNPLDLSDLAELSEGEFNFSSHQNAGSALNSLPLPGSVPFLELNDLEVPLVCPTDASGSESFLTDSLYSSSNRCDYEEQNCYPVNSIGPIQHVSSVNESLVPLEGFNGQGDYLDVFHKENDIREKVQIRDATLLRTMLILYLAGNLKRVLNMLCKTGKEVSSKIDHTQGSSNCWGPTPLSLHQLQSAMILPLKPRDTRRVLYFLFMAPPPMSMLRCLVGVVGALGTL